jgi:hypothetical protein
MQRWVPRLGSMPVAHRLRVLVAALALSVALASFMHVSHSHEAEGTGAAKLCQFCSSFDRGTAPPPAALAPLPAARPLSPPAAAAPPATSLSTARSYEARAPPHVQA